LPRWDCLPLNMPAFAGRTPGIPRPFRQAFTGNWKVIELPREKFIWDGWWIAGILLTLVVVYICCMILIRSLVARYSYAAALRHRQMPLPR